MNLNLFTEEIDSYELKQMGNKIEKSVTYHAKDRADWRNWLQANHKNSAGVWLIFNKKSGGLQRLPYSDSVEEALCFGWIDSTLNPRDEYTYMQLFTPRKPNSGWSKLNKERVVFLIEKGLMTDAGLEKIELAKKLGTWNLIDHIEDFQIPQELKEVFEKDSRLQDFYNALSASNKKYILYYLNNARLPATRAKRILEITTAFAQKKMPERFTPLKSKDAPKK